MAILIVGLGLLELWFKENEWQLNFRLNYN
jgi:hypothetical protein